MHRANTVAQRRCRWGTRHQWHLLDSSRYAPDIRQKGPIGGHDLPSNSVSAQPITHCPSPCPLVRLFREILLPRCLNMAYFGARYESKAENELYDEEARKIFKQLNIDPAKGGRSSRYNNLDVIYKHPTSGGKVYVGNIGAAGSLEELEAHGIRRVVNCQDKQSKCASSVTGVGCGLCCSCR